MIWRFGTICELDSKNRALVKASIRGRVTNFLPVLMRANSVKREWHPPQIGEQVVVLGDEHNDSVVIQGSIYHQQLKEPKGVNKNVDIVEYQDGSRIEYDNASHKLKITAVGDIEVACQKATVQASEVLIDSPKVDLGGSGGKGVVTGDCICPFTGNVHSDLSSIVKAKK